MTTELSAYAAEVFGTAGLPEKPNYPVVFVSPMGESVPEDGVFDYTTITDLSDIGAVKERSVILFRADQNEMLAVFAKNGALFGRAVQPLFGVPGSDYLVWFDDATFGLDRIAYGAFVAELRAASEIAEQLEMNSRSGTKVESDRYTTSAGKVRFSDKIETADSADDSDVDQ